MDNNSVLFRCKIENSDTSLPLDIEILLNGNRIYYNSHVKEIINFEHSLPDEDGQEHELVFAMTSKLPSHTEVDDSGNIVKDAVISVSGITIDDVDIMQLFIDSNVYTHNFNGSQPEIEDQFFGNIGCNGKVSFKFTSPFYLWLLENM